MSYLDACAEPQWLHSNYRQANIHIPILSSLASLSTVLRLNHLLRLLSRVLQILLQLLSLNLSLSLRTLQALVIRINPANLRSADHKHERIDARKRNVFGPDDEAPAGPNGAGAHEGEVLGQGERLGGAAEVGGAGEDHAPFHDRCPSGWLVWCVVAGSSGRIASGAGSGHAYQK